MQLGPLVVVCLCAFLVAYFVYGRLLARLFRLDPALRTPAHEHRDGLDFEPTPRFYLLGQHFSAISAAGPIAGPILAALWFGWQPALLWIVLGCIFIGSMHDFAALVGSLRHRACSVAEILKAHLNPRSYAVFTVYIWLALVYVITAFTDIENLELALPATETGPARELRVPGAGIASSSMLYLALAVLMGAVVRFLRPPLWLTTVVFVPLVGLAIWAGPRLPLDLAADGANPALTWAWIILVYCGIASVLPVWSLLQPRGYLGGFFLYVTLVGGLLGLLLANPEIQYPSFLGFTSQNGTPLVPFLFITIACGACSGFHGLVCSGTTSKQIDREPDARLVGYGGMLLEGVVALIALATVAVLVPGSPVSRLGADKVFGHGVGTFLSELGIPLQFAVSFGMLAFATFVYDTLDVCTRLARYLFAEFTGWQSRTSGVLGTVVTLLIPFWVVAQATTDPTGKAVPAYMVIWPLFGATNQLLAGLTLVGLTLWLCRTGKPLLLRWLVGVPMVFMMGMTITALSLQVAWAKGVNVVSVVAAVLLGLALWIAGEAVVSLLRRRPAPAV
jgi:carbon starvation protein